MNLIVGSASFAIRQFHNGNFRRMTTLPVHLFKRMEQPARAPSSLSSRKLDTLVSHEQRMLSIQRNFASGALNKIKFSYNLYEYAKVFDIDETFIKEVTQTNEGLNFHLLDPCLTIQIDMQFPELEINFTDNGINIPPKRLKLFKKIMEHSRKCRFV